MKFYLKIEEISMLILSLYLSVLLGYHWWLFILFLFVPDISMLGYLFGNKTGAIVYNAIHYKFLAVFLGILGYSFEINELAFAGAVLFGHSSFDRIFGYGLKYSTGFNSTHLKTIEKKEQLNQKK